MSLQLLGGIILRTVKRAKALVTDSSGFGGRALFPLGRFKGVAVKELDSLNIRLKAKGALFKDGDLINEAMDAGAMVLLSRVQERYLREEDAFGMKWEESKAAQRRRAEGRSGGTLYDTGTLFKSLGVTRLSNRAYKVGTDVPYGEVHQLGLQGLPQRRFLDANREDIDAVVDTIRSVIRNRNL